MNGSNFGMLSLFAYTTVCSWLLLKVELLCVLVFTRSSVCCYSLTSVTSYLSYYPSVIVRSLLFIELAYICPHSHGYLNYLAHKSINLTTISSHCATSYTAYLQLVLFTLSVWTVVSSDLYTITLYWRTRTYQHTFTIHHSRSSYTLLNLTNRLLWIEWVPWTSNSLHGKLLITLAKFLAS